MSQPRHSQISDFSKVPRSEKKERFGSSTASNYTLLSMTKVALSQSK
nr:hypothetical protein [Candidatus Enterovibrio escacola]